MASKKRILVIGGGISGIGSVKSLKEEGFDPVCYEKSSQVGGTWCYREETPSGLPSLMPTTVINHSKEMGAISNYIPDKNLPNYMRHQDLLKLFHDTGNHFDCFKHFVCNREVLKLRRSSDYDETGRWDVEVKNTLTGEVFHETYDGVMVCVGQFTYPKMPTYEGAEKFQGTIMHTHDLKGVDAFKGKKVVVVGMGCSALDAAVEISNVASQVYLSTRSGAWILPRVGLYGLPFDLVMLRRFAFYIQTFFGYKALSWYAEKYYIDTKFNHRLYNLYPEYPMLSKEPVTNDVLPTKLISGQVLMKRDIKYFTEKGVVFEDETKVTEADFVIMGTGYQWKYPFFDDDIIRVEEGRINLYKLIFPTHLKHPSLAIVGFILPFGPGFPLGEAQCRWVAQVFNGKCLPPASEEEKVADVIKRHEENSQRYAPSDRMTMRVDYIQYLDEISSLFGAKPNIWKYMFTDFTLFKALMFGPSLPYQYRLEGPHKWEGARDAILTVYERVAYPFAGKERKRRKKDTYTLGFFMKYLITFLLISFLLVGETSTKHYVLALVLPYIISWRGFYMKFLACLLLLPFYVTWSGFVASYMLTIFVPLLVASLT